MQDTLIGDVQDQLKVTFNPALYIQRRLWALNILREESVTQASLKATLSHAIPPLLFMANRPISTGPFTEHVIDPLP
jgi:hypothetical protein